MTMILYNPNSKTYVQIKDSYILDETLLSQDDYILLQEGKIDEIDKKYRLHPADFAVIKSIITSQLKKC